MYSLLFTATLLLIFTCCGISTTISAQEASTNNNNNPIIHNIPCLGSVEGIWDTVTNTETGEQRRVAKFMGIPYARPPVGNLRFKAPQPPQCINAYYNATYYRPMCPQFNNYGEGTKVVGAEDCLYIEAIYVPEKIFNLLPNTNSKNFKSASKNISFPVNVYTHGGNNMFGSGLNEKHGFFSAFYGDSHDDTMGCIDVTINYRLSILGYLAAPSFSEDDVNFGTQDNLAAAEWVKNNIMYFGGPNPKESPLNLISGQSSGGTNIFAMMASPRFTGLFRAAWSMSGSANISMDKRSKLMQDLPIIEDLGCSSKSGQDQITCLQNIPLETLFMHVPESWMTPSLCSGANLDPSGRHYVALPFVDGKIITTSFQNSLAIGMNQETTLVISGMGQECNLFPNQKDLVNYTQHDWKNYLYNTMFPAPLNGNQWPVSRSEIVESIYANYQRESEIAVDLAFFSLSADYGVSCASPKLIKSATCSRKSPIYISENQWPPSWPNNQAKFSYAFHIWDYLSTFHMWSELNEFEDFHPAKSDYDLSKLLRSQFYVLMNTGSLESWRNPTNSSVNWLPANQHQNFPNDWNTFVYSRPERFPFTSSGMVTSYKQKTCSMLDSFGIDDRFWWCN